MSTGSSGGGDGFERLDAEALGNIERESHQSTGWRLPPEVYARMIKLANKDPGFAEDLSTKARVLKTARRVLARHDSSAFAEYVLRTEGEGTLIRQAPMHDVMHRLVRDRDRVVIWGSPATGKSLQMAVAWPLWLLGRDPNLHIAIVQATDDLAKKTIRATANYISNPLAPGFAALREVFPDIAPSQTDVWNAHAITVKRTATARDPSYQACGVFGNILGARLDVVILDDVLTFNNTRSPDQRKRVVDWIMTTVVNRLDPEHGRFVFLGNAWHPDDAMHLLAEGRLEERLASDKAHVLQWASVRLPLRDEHGKTTWPDKWPQKLLEKRAAQLPPSEAARAFDCVATSDATSRFKRVWFQNAKKPRLAGELEPGKWALMRSIRPDGDPRTYYCGVDLAFADISKRGDRSAVSTIAVDSAGRVELVSIRSGRWTMDELIGEIVSASARWEPRFIFVESNAAQRVIGRMLMGDLAALGLDFPPDLKRRIRQYETGVTKHHPKYGLEGIGVEMAAGIWSIPCGELGEVHPEIEAFIQEMLHYTPDPKVHTGDRAMSCYMAWDGMRRRLGERGMTLVDVNERDTPPVQELLAPRIPARANESKSDYTVRLAQERQARAKAFADALANAANTQQSDAGDDW